MFRALSLNVPGFFAGGEVVLELLQGEAAEVLLRGQEGLLRGEHAIFCIGIAFDGVSVGVDGYEHSFFQGVAYPAPVHIEPPGMGIELDGHVMGRAGVDDRLVIDGITGAAEEEPACHVSKDGGIGIFDGAEQAHHRLFLIHLEIGVYGGDDEVEGGKDIICVIEIAVVEDIALDAFKDIKGGELFIEGFYFLVLLFDPFFGEAVGVKSALAVIADDHIFQALCDAGAGHFFQTVATVAPRAVAVYDGPDIVRLYERGDGIFACVGDDSLLLSCRGRDIVDGRLFEDLFFGGVFGSLRVEIGATCDGMPGGAKLVGAAVVKEGGVEAAGLRKIDIDEHAFGAAEIVDGGFVVGVGLFVCVAQGEEVFFYFFFGGGGDPLELVDDGELAAEFAGEGELFIGKFVQQSLVEREGKGLYVGLEMGALISEIEFDGLADVGLCFFAEAFIEEESVLLAGV